MKVAVPMHEGKLSPHFGRCAEVALIDVDPQSKAILNSRTIPTPPHEPGRFPVWLRAQGADVVIAGGMGQRALQLLDQSGVTVIMGAPSEPADAVVTAWLHGRLTVRDNACNHHSNDAHVCNHTHD